MLMSEGQLSSNDEGPQRSRRRSKRTKSKTTPGALRQWWWKHGTKTMLAFTAAWGIFGYLKLYSQSMGYELVGLTSTKADTLYSGGKPTYVVPTTSGERWVYRDGDRVAVVDFGRDGIVTNYLCTSVTHSPAACRPSYGIHLGTDEGSILNRLGTPSYERYDGTGKYTTYSGLHLTFRLEQGLVTAISRQPRRDLLGLIPNAIRSLVP